MEVTSIIVIAVVLVAALVMASLVGINVRRRLGLMAKYGDQQVVEEIMAHRIWEGMTREQLLDSWGRPAEIDERQLKSKVAHVYKYGRMGKSAFRERVKLDNDVVVGWEQRGKK